MEFCILGPLLIRGGSGPSTVPGAKERMLLARLVVDVNRTVGTQALVDELWADHPPPSAVKSLQTFVARLRAILEPEHRAPHSVLRFDQTGYRLAVNRLTVDAERFGDLLAAGRSAVDRRLPAEGRRHLTAALALWRGPALPELAGGPFGRAEQYRLEGLRWAAVESLAVADLALGHRETAVAALQRLLADQPYRESAVALLMVALHDGGRAAEALAVYERLRRQLADDLGVEPGADLLAVHGRVLRRRKGSIGPAADPASGR